MTDDAKPVSAALRDSQTGEMWHGETNHGLVYEKIPNPETRRLESGFATDDGRWISRSAVKKQTEMESCEELFGSWYQRPGWVPYLYR